MPELMSEEAVGLLVKRMQEDKVVKVCTLVTRPKAIIQLTHQVDFGGSMIYSLGFTD
jgi:DNA-binding Lrp family transcriptional regulator